MKIPVTTLWWAVRAKSRAIFTLAVCLATAGALRAADYAFGADLSFLKQAEDRGSVFKDNGQPKPGLQIFRDHGYNWVRLRVCVEPSTLPNNNAYTIAMATAAKKLGYKFLLSFHYSNAWADPTNEPTPKQWQGMNIDELENAVFEYTRDTIAAFKKAGVLPDMVQIGNEISNGMMWPVGKVRDYKTKETYAQNWPNLARLVYAGINGMDAGRGNAARPKVMIHVDHGGDIALTRWFFDNLIGTYEVPVDVIGFSFYPWSHGTLMDLKENLAFASREYRKDVMVTETGYFYGNGRYFKELPGPFPETPDGQRQWLEEVNRIVMDVPDGRGKGVYWWEPGNPGARGYFDENLNALPVMNVFEKFTRPVHRKDGQ
jgi:arabinogalactan endo-1,4-beta-galactosidase